MALCEPPGLREEILPQFATLDEPVLQGAILAALNSLQSEMKLLINQIAGLKEKRSVIEAHRTEIETDLRIRYAVDFFESSSSDLTEWNAFLMRQLIDWVKILSAGPPQEDYFIDYSDAGFELPCSHRAG